MSLKDELEVFVAARGPAGDEGAVAEVFEDRIAPHVDTIEWDAMGNVVATVEGSADHEILITGHTDELTLLVDGVTDAGFVSYSKVGGHYKGNFIGQEVIIGPDEVPGVIGTKCRHHTTPEERERLLADDLYIDIGADSPEEVRKLNVEPGDHATWNQTVTELGYERVAGRAIDDRIALAILVELARQVETDSTVHYVATVQEEIGLRGARAAGYNVDPYVGIAVEIFPSDDYPAADDGGQDIHLGDGPVIELADGNEYLFDGILVDRQTLSWLRHAAKQAGVDHQFGVMINGTTDASELQRVRGGRHAGPIGVPCRYTHSPIETISLADAEQTVAVLAEACESEFPDRTSVRSG
jgi:endoglucanase